MPTRQLSDASQLKSRIKTPLNAERVTPAYLERVTPALIFVISLLYLFLFRRYSVIDPDEGIVLQGAERILRGEVPYRDFFMFYTPGSIYIVAVLFKLFGDSLAVARTSIAAVGAGCSAITYLLARRVCSRNIALLAAGLTITNSVAYRPMVLHNWYSTFFACLAIYAAVHLLESQKPEWAFATGSFAALTALIEQSKGAGLCLGFTVGFVVLRVLGRKDLLRASALTPLVVGFVWPWILTFLYFGSTHSIAAMLQDWLWPLHHYTRVNQVPYGYQDWSNQAREGIFLIGTAWIRIIKVVTISPVFIVPVLPMIGAACLIYGTLRLRNKKPIFSECDYYVLVSAALTGLLLSVLMVRADITHLMDLAPLWYVLLAWALGANDFQSRLLGKLRPGLLVYVCVAFGMMSLALLLHTRDARNQIYTRRGVIRTRGQDTVIDYVQAHVAPGDELLVYPYLPLYNYLTATRSPARLDFFQAGMNTPEQAEEIVASLKLRKVHAVLFEPGFSEKFAISWPGTPLNAIANDAVADFIVRNYHVCSPLTASSGWRFQFMLRKEEACP